jgi:hypothetical protein
MPGLILLLTVAVSLCLVGSELLAVYAGFQPLPWGEWLPMLSRVLESWTARLMSVTPCTPYAIAAVMAGVLEGIYWRSKQVWRGYHRSLWQLSLSPLVLALALLTSWVIARYDPGSFRLWAGCLLLAPAAFAITAGYKVSTTR